MAGQPTPGPYVIGQPGGPAGPFWSLVNQQGEVVAMQITTEANARFLGAAPALLAVLARICDRGGDWTEVCDGEGDCLELTPSEQAKPEDERSLDICPWCQAFDAVALIYPAYARTPAKSDIREAVINA